MFFQNNLVFWEKETVFDFQADEIMYNVFVFGILQTGWLDAKLG